MTWSNLLRLMRSVWNSPNRRRMGVRRRPSWRAHQAAETFEARTLLAGIVVDSALDNFDPLSPTTDGLVTLREAVLAANTDAAVGDAPAGSGPDTITFDPTEFAGPQTITLSMGELEIEDDLTITGTGQANLTIDGNNASRIFDIDDGNNLTQATVSISGLTLTGGNVVGDGGGIRNTEDLTIADSTISGNAAVGGASLGGGLFNDARGTTEIVRSTISGNSANDGGGVASVTASASLDITDSTVSGNTATAVGGGVYLDYGTHNISGSTISGNSALSGGGIYNYYGNIDITNSTISGNSATGGDATNGMGGGVVSYYGSTDISHSTITGNTAVRRGGGVYTYLSPVSIENSIVAGNTAATGSEISRAGGPAVSLNAYNILGDSSKTTADAVNGASAGGNDITATSDGTNPTALGSILDTALSDNGGSTLTHGLVAGSIAIDAGNPAPAAPPSFDQRGSGFDRIVGGRLDIGAYESGTEPTLDASLINGGSINRSGIATIELSFSQSVTIASVASLMLTNDSTMTAESLDGAVLTNNGTATITLNLLGLTTPLADANYTLHIPPGAATNVMGTGLDQTYQVGFHKLTGDVDGSRVVLFDDYLAIQANFTASVAPFGDGDADGSGLVLFDDYLTVQSNFTASLPVPPSSVYYDESIDGELSTDNNAPTDLGVFAPGENIVIGQVTDIGGGFAGTADIFTFEIAAGQQLDTIFMTDFSTASGAAVFLALDDGPTFLYSPEEINDMVDFPDLTQIMGGTTAGTANIGTDILDDLEDAVNSGNGSAFTTPLGPGQYTIYIQETGPESNYTLTFNVSNAPPPIADADAILPIVTPVVAEPPEPVVADEQATEPTDSTAMPLQSTLRRPAFKGRFRTFATGLQPVFGSSTSTLFSDRWSRVIDRR